MTVAPYSHGEQALPCRQALPEACSQSVIPSREIIATFDEAIIAWYTHSEQHRFSGSHRSNILGERGRMIHTRCSGMALGLPVLIETVRAVGAAINAEPAAATCTLDAWRPAIDGYVGLS